MDEGSAGSNQTAVGDAERYATYCAIAMVLLAVAGTYVAYLNCQAFSETRLVATLSVGLMQSDVESRLGPPDDWLTTPDDFAREPYARFPASTRPIESAVAAYRHRGRVIYIYYDAEHTVTCFFMSRRTPR